MFLLILVSGYQLRAPEIPEDLGACPFSACTGRSGNWYHDLGQRCVGEFKAGSYPRSGRVEPGVEENQINAMTQDPDQNRAASGAMQQEDDK